jgi:PadR family transcriptional regulator PadR
MRHTASLAQVALALMADPKAKHWGYQLSKASGVRSGVLYPILGRMLEEGILADGWEELATADKRPPRRYYEITTEGLLQLGAVLHEARSREAARQPKGGVAWAT